MPLKSFSFNGIRKPWIYMLAGRQKAPFAPVQWNTLTIPGRPGVVLQSKQTLPIVISQPIGFLVDDDLDALAKKDELAAWLLTDEPVPLEFDDEPGRVYYAVVQNTIEDFEIFAKTRKGTIQFLVPEGYGYGPLRTQTINVPPASFSRNSIAYLSDGTQVAANQPRFEQGGILIEEGTTNLIPSALAKNLTSAWTSGTLNGTYTLSVRGGTGQVNISGGYTGSVAVGQTLTFSVANKTITLTPANGTPQFVQLEQKPYATSFVDGTRASETLTLPADGVLNPEEGTIEAWVYVADTSFNRAIVVLDARDSTGANRMYLELGLSKKPSAIIQKGAAYIATGNNPLSPGWHFVAATWSFNRLTCYADGVLVAQYTNPMLLDSFSSAAIGSTTIGEYQFNSLIGPLRISRIARSDAEILDAYQNGFTVDEYTSAYLPFDGDLNVQAPNVVENKGTADADPVFTLYVQQPTTFAMIQNQNNEYMLIGQPIDVETQVPVQREERILWDQMATTTGWAVAEKVDGAVAGSIESTGYAFQPKDYGTGTGWHGPALKKSLPEVLTDFHVEAIVELYNGNPAMIGRVEIYMLDEAGDIIGKIALKDVNVGTNTTYGEARIGNGTVNHHLIDETGEYPWTWNNFYGILRIGRHNGEWFAYIAKIDQSTGKHHSRMYRTYTDTDKQFTKNLAQIAVHFGQRGTYTPANVRIQDLKVFKWNTITQAEIPYIAQTGDIITFDHTTKDILINGESRKDLKDFGARFFHLQKGENQFVVLPSNSFAVRVRYRERFL